MRTDLHGLYFQPQSTADFLSKFGGRNPHGEPNYRLIHTSSRWWKMGGVWNEWPDKMKLEDRGGLSMVGAGVLLPTLNRPIRQVAEMRELLKYEHIESRWILERWCPAVMYGAKEAWLKAHPPGHPELPFRGPFPEMGEYEMAGDPTPHVPGNEELSQVIQRVERLSSERHASVEQAVIERHNDAVERYEKEMKEEREVLEAQMLDMMIPTGRVSLAAGRHRELLAKRLGIRSHVGN